MKKIKKNKKGNKFVRIFDLFLTIIFITLTVFLVINIIKLANIENLIRGIVIGVLIIISILLVIFKKKKKILCRILMIILALIYIILNYTFYKVYNSLDDMTNKVDTKGICLLTHIEDIKDIKDLTKGDIAIINKEMDEQFYEMAEDVLKENKIKNDLVEYEDYLHIINDLLNKKIKYAFLPENYNDIYSAANGGEEKEPLKFNVLYNEQKAIKNEETVEIKDLGKPFTILLMGSDVLLDSYNADTLMVVTVNPKTMKMTMLSIPRDTYTTIACTGGKHKINASGWYGDKCVVKTVAKYLDVNIDYYAKINFLGIVDLVNKLGGVEVDVPYALCEQNSKRQFGKNMVYIEAGKQNLNGEQALALSRNRHYWTGMCPKKYTTAGERSDITRGKNQQLVIKAILSKLMTVRDLNTFYGILDTIGNNMTTNMPKETILSFYNIGKDVVKRFNTSSADDIMNIKRLTFKSYSTRIFLSGLELSMIVNYDESVEYVSKEMKKNLGLIKEKNITTFEFDINESYNPEEVKFNKLTSSLNLFPSFVGKTLKEANAYCLRNSLKCESNIDEENGIITSQSVAAKTDLSILRGKTIKFEIKKTEESKPIEDLVEEENNDQTTEDNNTNNNEENNPDTPTTDNNETDNQTPENDDNKEETKPQDPVTPTPPLTEEENKEEPTNETN